MAETTTAAQISRDQVIAALEHDRKFFINFYLAEELEFPVPDFHAEIFDYMADTSVSRFAIAVPRGHAKTTIAKLACVWYLYYTKFRFIVYVSNTAPVAKAALNDIINFLRCPNHVATFGRVEFTKESANEGWYEFDITLPDGTQKHCTLKALGAGQQVRGLNVDNKRPELAVVDDLEDEENLRTEAALLQLKKWFYGTFVKALAHRNKVIHIGNAVANKCLILEHCMSPAWHSMLYGCLRSDGTSLWPDLWPIEKIRADFLEYQELKLTGVWFAEMMNMPTMGDNKLIDLDSIIYRNAPIPGTAQKGFISIDLAISKKQHAHKTAITVHVFDGTCWMVADHVARVGMGPIDVYNTAIDLAFKWGVSVVGIESVAYQAALKHVFDYLCTTAGVEGLQFVDINTGGQKKYIRLKTWASLLESGVYALPLGDFEITNQLVMYDPLSEVNDDDLIDSCAGGAYMIANYQEEISQMLAERAGGLTHIPSRGIIEISAI